MIDGRIEGFDPDNRDEKLARMEATLVSMTEKIERIGGDVLHQRQRCGSGSGSARRWCRRYRDDRLVRTCLGRGVAGLRRPQA